MSAIKKIRVLLVQGGPSVEHDISIKSARMVASALDDTRFDYHLVHITRNGKWKFKNNAELPFGRAMMKIERGNFDVAFIALHGTFGEDGKIQSVFEALGLPYIGSGPEASSCALNKATSASIFKENGLTHPNFIHLTNTSQKPKLDRFTFPLVVKPCHGGSSIQISFAKNPSQVWSAAKKILASGDSVIIQRVVRGRELTCGILDDTCGKPHTLPPTEIIPAHGSFFNFKSKYSPGGSREVTPPHLPQKWIRKIQDSALKAHLAFGCSGMSRSDFILDGKKLYILEINTIPGMTETSLLPQEAVASGISFPQMLNRIILSALQKP